MGSEPVLELRNCTLLATRALQRPPGGGMMAKQPKLSAKEFKAQQVKAAATRQNPIRFRMALPNDVDLDDIAWKPTQLEKRWARLARLDAQFQKAQEEYRQFRIGVCERMIAADLAWLAKHKDA